MFKFISIILIILVFSNCSKKEENTFMQDFMETKIIYLDKEINLPDINYVDYKNKNKSKNLKEVYDKGLKSFENSSLYGLTSIYQKEDGIDQCVIIIRYSPEYKKSNSQPKGTLEHEFAHCFHHLLFKALKKERKYDLFDKKNNALSLKKEYYKNTIEPFAEVVSSFRMYSITKSFDYLENSIKVLEDAKSTDEMKPYKKALPLLKGLKNYINSTDDIPYNVEDQINKLIDQYFIPKLLK